MKRKYQQTTGYWVYAHVLPTREVYIGMSKLQPCFRWRQSMYKDNSLAPYITEFGWENIVHKVLVDGLTKNEAEQWEDRIIQALSMNGLCINEKRSGGIARDDYKAYKKEWEEDHKEERKAHMKQWNEDHKDYHKQYHKQYYSTPEGKIYYRVRNYNKYHTPIETPMEAKQKYLQWGYIPNYIKNDDLI